MPNDAFEVLPPGHEIGPIELKRILDERVPIAIVDVRELYEWQICRIPGATLIPLAQLPARLNELNPTQATVVMCRSGGRSLQAVDFMKRKGFSKVRNLTGGILAWSDQVDPAVPKY